MSLNYCPVPGASQPRGMRFDTENSRCIPAERMTPEEMRQLHRLAIERRPEACLGCGLEHNCLVYGHGCAVIRKALRLLGGEADVSV